MATATPRTFDETLEATVPELEEVARETLAEPTIQAALESDVDESW